MATMLKSVQHENDVLVRTYKETLEKERHRAENAENQLKLSLSDFSKVRDNMAKDILSLGGERDAIFAEMEAMKDKLDNETVRCVSLE